MGAGPRLIGLFAALAILAALAAYLYVAGRRRIAARA
jgi:hypothetical protein